MRFLRDFIREAKTYFYQSFYKNSHRIELDKAIISISFDDVPYSAMENGIPILDKHGISATFYIASGLAKNNSSTNDRYLSDTEVKKLNSLGHHIACHTYSHYRLEEGSAEEMQNDSTRNIQVLTGLLEGKAIEHFSYPFGQVSFKVKKLLSEKYKTMRSSRPGINYNLTDFHLLRATSIYNPTFDKTLIKKLIDMTVEKGGWLIFYTHGVENNPKSFDCTPEQLDWVLDQCIRSNAHILPVSEAYDLIMKNKRQIATHATSKLTII